MGSIVTKAGSYHNRIEGLYFAYVVNVALLLLVYSSTSLRDSLNQCAIKMGDSQTVSPTHYLRGGNYLLDKINEEGPKCIITRWNVSHFISYLAYGYCFPKWKWLAVAVGILFELLEWFMADCHDLTDLLANTLGCLTGAKLSQWFVGT